MVVLKLDINTLIEGIISTLFTCSCAYWLLKLFWLLDEVKALKKEVSQLKLREPPKEVGNAVLR